MGNDVAGVSPLGCAREEMHWAEHVTFVQLLNIRSTSVQSQNETAHEGEVLPN